MLRAFSFWAASLLVAMLLEGCDLLSGAEPAVSTTATTVTTMTTTATTSTTMTTTTVTGLGHCTGRPPVHLHPRSVQCFCFYTGTCPHQFACSAGEPLGVCQQRVCGEAPLEVNTDTTSFFNIKAHWDVLTIPNLYYIDVGDMSKKCADRGFATMTKLLEDGRRVFKAAGLGGGDHPLPEWQCVHLPHHVGVEWLHLHSFNGKVRDEALPNRPPSAGCAFGNMTVSEAAHKILSYVASASVAEGSKTEVIV